MLRAPYIKTAVDQSSLPASCSLRRKDGGGERDRTDGLLVANQALSQLSYTPGAHSPVSPIPVRHPKPLGPTVRAKDGGPR